MSNKWTSPLNTTVGLTDKKTLTQYNILVADSGSNTVAFIAPDAVIGKPILSTSAATVPAYGALTVPVGGTTASTFVAYTPVCIGTNSTAALQSVASLGSANLALTSDGNAAHLPTFATALPGGATTLTSINMQVFTADGTYTPTAKTVYFIAEVVGGGGGGGGTINNTSGRGFSAGGGSGAYSKSQISSIAASYAITIGTAGAGGTAGNNGSTGGTTNFGSGLITAVGGSGGSKASAPNNGSLGGSSGVNGEPGETGFTYVSGDGGSSPYGSGAIPLVDGTYTTTSTAGNNGTGYGSGGGGAYKNNTTNDGGRSGGNGSAGCVIITEFVGT